MSERLPLTRLPALLNDAQIENPGYRAIYEAARSARIPVRAERNGRWTFDPEDLPLIADALGLSDAYAA